MGKRTGFALARRAAGHTQESFAEALVVDRSTVVRWEAGDHLPLPYLWPKMARLLGVSGHRLAELLDAPLAESTAGFRVTNYRFAPVWVGTDRAADLAALDQACPTRTMWLDTGTIDLSAAGESMTATVFGFGVVVVTAEQTVGFESIAELAIWRRESHRQARTSVASALDAMWPGLSAVPEYVLSCFWVEEHGWRSDDLDTAIRLLCVPSTLLDRSPGRTADDLLIAARAAERDRFRSGVDHPDVRAFGAGGAAIGYASWSGVAYCALTPGCAVQRDELLTLETLVQGLWCYTDHLSQVARAGSEPEVPDSWSWRFLRRAMLELGTARPRESNQQRMMCDAILTTSRLVTQTQDVITILRDAP